MLDIPVKEVQPNAPADFQVPELVRTATERVTAEKLADGVWFIAGGSHHSVAIEMKDHSSWSRRRSTTRAWRR